MASGGNLITKEIRYDYNSKPKDSRNGKPSSRIFTSGKTMRVEFSASRNTKSSLRSPSRADVVRVLREMTGIDLSKEPSWVQCPKCDGTWTKLTPNGICVDCEENR